MRIGGYQQTSLIDYPGKVAAVIFTAGCNFRCPYCHNRDLVLARSEGCFFEASEVLEDLEERRNFLDGVVLTGGEPTLQKDLPDFVKKIKDLGLLVKLDTNGSNTSILCSMVKNELVDFVALDVKASLDHRYARSVGISESELATILLLGGAEGDTQKQGSASEASRFLQSMVKIAESGVDFELRTTVVPGLHSEEDLLDLARQLSEITPKAKWVLQNFQPKNCLDPEFENVKPYDSAFFENLVKKLKVYMPAVRVR